MADISKIHTISDLAAFCKRKGFVFPSAEIYGGFSGFFDYGPLGIELKENIKKDWWKTFVQSRQDVIGIDGSAITNPKVLEASGHVAGFNDLLVDCKKCKFRERADHLIEDLLKIPAEHLSAKQIQKLIEKHKIKCPKCKGPLSEPKQYNTMFKTYVGPVEQDSSVAYLRPETAQSIFSNFELIQKSSRAQLPFGIAQIGKAFRNEISPRDFLFRMREFEQMELEFFTHPKKINDCPFYNDIQTSSVNMLSAEMQNKGKNHKAMTIKSAVIKKIIKNRWHAYWLYSQYQWFLNLGINPKNLRIREHKKEELAHYAKACFDLEYKFPFGWKELQGMADRGQFDLSQHGKYSGKEITFFDQAKQEHVVPYVAAEPSQGLDRAFLAFLIDAYTVEKDRVVLKLNPKLAPIKIAIFPLVNKDKLPEVAMKIYNLLKDKYPIFYDTSGSIGRRYRRMDESGTPFCLTIDHDTLKDKAVTVRHRDSMKQKRVKIKDLETYFLKLI